MAGDVLVKVEGLSKKFCKDLKTSLWYGVKDLVSGIIGNHNDGGLRAKEFWAVKDINFELRRGECLGLIGHNGAGKSTLLKILNGLINPDEGSVTMRGRIGALIELGAGFNPILTGRENIYNNGAVLGFTRKEIDAKVEEIIDFSEIREFIDMPVQNYSSGMKVRLGFSVAAQMEPDVLIIDEVFAVGDAGFKIKSYNKLTELTRKCAVIFVSHTMPSVMRISSKAAYMDHGQVKYFGNNINKAIELYYLNFEGENPKIEFNDGAEITSFKLNNKDLKLEDTTEVEYLGTLSIELDILLKHNIKEFFVSAQITDKDLKIVGQYYTNKFYPNFTAKDRNTIKIELTDLQFIDGDYTITYFICESIGDNYTILAAYRNYNKLRMIGLNDSTYSSVFMKGKTYHNGVELTQNPKLH